jgi:hypothetical protein
VSDFALRFGWIRVHFGGDQHRRAHYDATGFPDLLLIHVDPPLILFRELKSDTGRQSPAQEAWEAKLRAGRFDYALWRPCDWPEIVELLSFGTAAVQT